jgi:hypothetical protein
MKIGQQFNKKCELILLEACKASGMKSGVRLSVEKINHFVGLDRHELRLYLEYMSDKGLLELYTIGGPFLYGHIGLTNAGITKISCTKRKLKSETQNHNCNRIME